MIGLSFTTIALLLGVGAAGGLLAGLLGVGGGLIIVAALAFALPGLGVPAASVMHVALATSMATIVATSLSSTRAHLARSSVMWTSVRWLVPGLVAGGLLGAAVADRLTSEALRLGVALFCFAAGAQLAVGRTPPDHGDAPAPRGPTLSAVGIAIGALSALVGIGGGSMTVPLLIALGARPVRAVGTSAACGFAIAIASATAFVVAGHDARDLPDGTWGYVHVPGAIAIALASVLAAPYGAALAHRLRGAHLKRVFAAFLALIGAAMLFAR